MTYPFSPLVALAVAGLLLAFAPPGWLRKLGIVALAAGYLGCTSLVANGLVGLIESRATGEGDACDGLQAIVVLGGGLQRPPRDAHDALALNAETQQRLLNFLARDQPSLPLVLSGGGDFPVSEAALMAAFLQRVAPQRRVALLETVSKDTWTNATQTARMLPPPRRIALATSALHLPRARRAFEAQGYTVCPWPVNSLYSGARAWWALLPHSGAARRTEAVLHEVGGMVLYAWRETPLGEAPQN